MVADDLGHLGCQEHERPDNTATGAQGSARGTHVVHGERAGVVRPESGPRDERDEGAVARIGGRIHERGHVLSRGGRVGIAVDHRTGV